MRPGYVVTLHVRDGDGNEPSDEVEKSTEKDDVRSTAQGPVVGARVGRSGI